MTAALTICLHEDTYWFDEAAVERVYRFFSCLLRHVKGDLAGQSFDLDEWQKRDIISPLFGWKRSDGTRRYRTAYIELPKKNGKSSLSAAIALYMLASDGEPGAEIYCAAADREQATIVFETAKQMVLASPQLRKRIEPFRRSMTYGNNSFKVLSSDASTKHGFNSSCVILDELHAHKSRELADTLTTGTAARRQPLTIIITTAGYDRHSICWEYHDYAQKVEAGVIDDPSFLPVIYAAEPEDDWKDEKTWRKANPGYGVSVKAEYLAEQAAKAQEIAAYENTFKRLHLNIWTEQASRLIPMDRWNECKRAFEESALEGKACFAGLDLSTTTDLSAFLLISPQDNNEFYALPYFWIPKEGARQRGQRDKVPYEQWIRQGYIKATEGNVIDYDVIRADINQLRERFNIVECAVDRWNATQLATQLQGDGLLMTMFGQGFASMANPTKELMTLILSNKLLHNGHPVLTWCASNLAAAQDAAGNLKPDKSKSSERIDGMVALIMALGRAMVTAKPTSVYEERGIITL